MKDIFEHFAISMVLENFNKKSIVEALGLNSGFFKL